MISVYSVVVGIQIMQKLGPLRKVSLLFEIIQSIDTKIGEDKKKSVL